MNAAADAPCETRGLGWVLFTDADTLASFGHLSGGGVQFRCRAILLGAIICAYLNRQNYSQPPGVYVNIALNYFSLSDFQFLQEEF